MSFALGQNRWSVSVGSGWLSMGCFRHSRLLMFFFFFFRFFFVFFWYYLERFLDHLLFGWPARLKANVYKWFNLRFDVHVWTTLSFNFEVVRVLFSLTVIELHKITIWLIIFLKVVVVFQLFSTSNKITDRLCIYFVTVFWAWKCKTKWKLDLFHERKHHSFI